MIEYRGTSPGDAGHYGVTDVPIENLDDFNKWCGVNPTQVEQILEDLEKLPNWTHRAATIVAYIKELRQDNEQLSNLLQEILMQRACKTGQRQLATDFVVNGRNATTLSSHLDYEFLAARFGRGQPRPSITYKHPDGRAGSLVPGQSLWIQEGTVLNIMDTGNA